MTIFFFPQAEMQADIDNCAKPILDAMGRFVYADDRQVDRMVVQKFEPERPWKSGARRPISWQQLSRRSNR